MNFTSVNEIRATFAEIHEQTSEIISNVAGQIKDEAHPDGNMDWLQRCAKTLEQLKRDQQSMLDIEKHHIDVLENILGFESDKFAVSVSGLRMLTIEVSQGMINQHLLTLTHAKKLGKVSLGEKFEITLPDGTSFTTDLCDPGNKLRERGLIRQFYEGSKIKEGQKVVLEETSAGKWRLRPVLASDELEAFAAMTREYGPDGPNTEAPSASTVRKPRPAGADILAPEADTGKSADAKGKPAQ